VGFLFVRAFRPSLGDYREKVKINKKGEKENGKIVPPSLAAAAYNTEKARKLPMGNKRLEQKRKKCNCKYIQLRQQIGALCVTVLLENAVIDGNWISRGSGFAYAV